MNGAMQSARLYRLTFDSLENPTGGTIDLVVDSASLTGTDGLRSDGFDNITVARRRARGRAGGRRQHRAT